MIKNLLATVAAIITLSLAPAMATEAPRPKGLTTDHFDIAIYVDMQCRSDIQRHYELIHRETQLSSEKDVELLRWVIVNSMLYQTHVGTISSDLIEEASNTGDLKMYAEYGIESAMSSHFATIGHMVWFNKVSGKVVVSCGDIRYVID